MKALRSTIATLRRFFWILALLLLWQGLIRHLSVEWSVNPQYGYAWAVPFLCAYLLWRGRAWQGEVPYLEPRFKKAPSPRPSPPDEERENAGMGQGRPPRSARKSEVLRSASIMVLALLYGTTRLVQEANPDWRLVSWLLALEVVGLTILALPFLPRFPFFFFLSAVPWPTMVERPVIRTLTAATTSTAVEILGYFGIPSVLHGNIIEVGHGMVGVDEACSGIRSVQAALMLAFFFGEVCRLRLIPRGICLLAGIALAFQFNVLRTTLLAFVAATKGPAAIEIWHDPAGVSTLLSCFLALWVLVVWLRILQPRLQPVWHNQIPTAVRACQIQSSFGLLLPAISPLTFGGWLLLTECGTEVWYRFHEPSSPASASWRISPPKQRLGYCENGFRPQTRQFLRFDEGLDATWRDDTGLRWQLIFLRWNPGRVAAHLAKNHTPDDCLTASGHEILERSDPRRFSVYGLDLPFRSYVVRGELGLARVFYCLWQDRAMQRPFDAEWLTYSNRLRAVLRGERNCGQRSLELVLRGARNEHEAEDALRCLLPEIIQIVL